MIAHDFDALLRHVRQALPGRYSIEMTIDNDDGVYIALIDEFCERLDFPGWDDTSPYAALQAALAHAVREAAR